jgi:hypothetical protein
MIALLQWVLMLTHRVTSLARIVTAMLGASLLDQDAAAGRLMTVS